MLRRLFQHLVYPGHARFLSMLHFLEYSCIILDGINFTSQQKICCIDANTCSYLDFGVLDSNLTFVFFCKLKF